MLCGDRLLRTLLDNYLVNCINVLYNCDITVKKKSTTNIVTHLPSMLYYKHFESAYNYFIGFFLVF